MPPEVGKIGTNSPTFIQPVSERTDGIKSFFSKQQSSSPAKSKLLSAKADLMAASKGVDRQVKAHFEMGLRSDIAGDVEENLGDDSNAPNPDDKREAKHEDDGDLSEEVIPTSASQEAKPLSQGKRKREKEADDDERNPGEIDEGVKEADRRGGHQIKVIRREDNSDKTVSAPLQSVSF